MKKKNKARRISYADWIFSRDRWLGILKRTEAGEYFSNPYGFEDLDVWDSCLCTGHVPSEAQDTFWSYLAEMKGLMDVRFAVVNGVHCNEFRWSRARAVTYARQIVLAIDAGKPSRSERLMAWLNKGWERPTIIE